MCDLKPKPGSFTAYLEFARRDRGTGDAPPPSPLTLVEMLSGLSTRSLPMAELPDAQRHGTPHAIGKLSESLVGAGYVEIEGPSLDEVVRLTDKGAEAARLARPA